MNEPYRILQIGMSANYAGTEAYIMNQYRKLDRKKLTYDFLDITDNEAPIACYDEIVSNGDNIYKLPFPNRKNEGIFAYFKLAKWLMNSRSKYLGLVMNINDPYTSFPLLMARILGYKKVVAHAHNACYQREMSIPIKILYALNKKIINLATTDKLACSSKAGCFLFGNNNFKVIKNGIDLTRFKFSSKNRDDIRKKLGWESKFIIGNIGRFCYQKNQEFILDLFRSIYNANSNTRLILIGDGKSAPKLYQKIRTCINDNDLYNVVKIVEPCAEIEKYYSVFDVFILPSRFEGLPFVGVEAQANGLPCFFSANISSEVKLTNKASFLSLEDMEVWKDKILKLAIKSISDSDLEKQRVGNYDKEIATKGYDLNEQVRKVTELYLL